MDNLTFINESMTIEEIFEELDIEYGKTSYGKIKFSVNEMYWIGYIYRYLSYVYQIDSKNAYKIIKGTRGQQGLNEKKYTEIIVRLSSLLRFATEIKELDINPLIADSEEVVAVDARIRIEKNK